MTSLDATGPESSLRPWEIPADAAGMRLDSFLASRIDGWSRAQLRKVFDAGGVTIAGQPVKPSMRLEGGETVDVRLEVAPPMGPQPEPIDLDILYEDELLAVINKPAAMVVHPGRGNWEGTLAAALAHHFEHMSTLAGPMRAGIVHRLDRDTTGVIVVAKSNVAHQHLADQFRDRTVKKEYLAITVGIPQLDRDLIDRPIGVHPQQRAKMALRPDDPKSRSAQTVYEVLERFPRHAFVQLLPKTGRTHQIRVHLASLGCPVLCDRLYGGRATVDQAALVSSKQLPPPETDAGTPLIARQALHAHRLEIEHPQSGERMLFEAPLGPDMQAVLHVLRGQAE